MKPKNKLIIIILVAIFILFFYFFVTAKKISFQNNSSNLINNEILRENYQETVASAFNIYIELQNTEKLEMKDVKAIKEKLLNLTVPKEFKEIHMNLFLAINKMEEYLLNNDLEAKKISEDIIENELKNNTWLNN